VSKVTGEVVHNLGAGKPFKIVFAHDDNVIIEWPVDSVEEGERQIVEALQSLQGFAREQGYIK
jgi:hypothetical protein